MDTEPGSLLVVDDDDINRAMLRRYLEPRGLSITDARDGADGWEARRAELRARLAEVHRPRDLAALPPNDLASSPAAERLRGLGAFRADVTGAGPAVYGLFHHRAAAEAASRELAPDGGTWVTLPAWYV